VKHLKVEVNGIEWVNGDFEQVDFSDGPNGVRVAGRSARAATGGGGGGLLDLLASASRARSNGGGQTGPVEAPEEPPARPKPVRKAASARGAGQETPTED